MTAHHHHVHEGATLGEAAQAALEQAGEQWTDMRQAVFDALARAERAISAYDIAETLSAARGKRVAPNSIYRILDLFVANNLARKVESANAYVANSHPGCIHDCIFMVCDQCGQVTHVDDDSLSRQLRRAACDSGFAGDRAIIELRGKCRTCAAGACADAS